MVPKCVHVVIKGFRIILPTNSLKCMVLSCDWGKHNKDNQWTNYKWYGSVSWCGLVLQIHSGCTDAYVPSLHTVDEILIRNGSMSSLIPSQVSSSVLEAETPAVCVRGRDFRLFCKMAWKPSVSCFVRLYSIIWQMEPFLPDTCFYFHPDSSCQSTHHASLLKPRPKESD